MTLSQCDVHCHALTAVTLPQCDGSLGKKAIELRENVAQQTVTCDGTGQTGQVQWKYISPDGTTTTLVTCSSPSSCTTYSDRFATGTRNSTSSTMTFVTQASRASHGTRSVSCLMTPATQETCQLDVVCESVSQSVSQSVYLSLCLTLGLRLSVSLSHSRARACVSLCAVGICV